jgi:hypothetical protein
MSDSRPGRHVVRKAPADSATPEGTEAKETAKIDIRELQGLIDRLTEKPAEPVHDDHEIEIVDDGGDR